MAIHERAGQVATQKDLINLPKLMSQYYCLIPTPEESAHAVSFGTSGHRGCASKQSFNQHHLWAIAQATVDYRLGAGIRGPLFVGIDTHALSQVAYCSVLEVLAANNIDVRVHRADGYTPTPVISRLIVAANSDTNNYASNQGKLADGLVITPSHNPPQDGGIKYNPPHGGPAEGEITSWIEARANQYLKANLQGINKLDYAAAIATGNIKEQDFITPYVDELDKVVDMDAIAKAGIRIGVDPLGGSGIHYWQPIAERYGLNISLVNESVDPRFAFMSLDKDGKIRMDCSSPYAMAGLLKHQDEFDICVGNDPDYDRHGIVCPGFGLMNPNHFLAVAIDYLLSHRPDWPSELAIGKTLVSSAIIDRVCAAHDRKLMEVPVGFKWFVEGLSQASIAFGGEESAGAAFLQRDANTWCTDKDGFILALLAAEILAVTGKSPAERYQELEAEFGTSYYRRIDSPIDADRKAKFAKLDASQLDVKHLGGDSITAVLTHAPGNNAAIGGLKVCTEHAWFAARPSGTEALFKLYAESFVSDEHLDKVIAEAQQIIEQALAD